MKYEEMIAITEQALDLFPVKQFLNCDKDVETIMSNIEYEVKNRLDNYPALKSFMFNNRSFFDRDIFNLMLDFEFIRYCEKRFPEVHWDHEIVEKYWVSRIDKDAINE